MAEYNLDDPDPAPVRRKLVDMPEKKETMPAWNKWVLLGLCVVALLGVGITIATSGEKKEGVVERTAREITALQEERKEADEKREAKWKAWEKAGEEEKQRREVAYAIESKIDDINRQAVSEKKQLDLEQHIYEIRLSMENTVIEMDQRLGKIDKYEAKKKLADIDDLLKESQRATDLDKYKVDIDARQQKALSRKD